MTDTATKGCLTRSRTHRSFKGTSVALSHRQRCRSGFAGVEKHHRALPTPVHEACAVAAGEHVRPVLAPVVCDVPRARDLDMAHRPAGGRIRGVPGAYLHHLP